MVGEQCHACLVVGDVYPRMYYIVAYIGPRIKESTVGVALTHIEWRILPQPWLMDRCRKHQVERILRIVECHRLVVFTPFKVITYL